jgi:uncharacterized membrane protein YoaK (UPF0700 family)
MGRARLWTDRPVFLLALTAVAGWVDALSFLALGKVFTSFMSGNWLFLGIGAGTGDGGLAVRAGTAMAAFVAGGAVGARLLGARLSPAGSQALRGLRLEAVVLVCFAAVWIVVGDPEPQHAVRLVLLALAAAAMGIQAALSLALQVPNVATVALTASLAQLARLVGLSGTERRPHDPGEPSAALLLALCLCYLVSALVVAVLPRTALLAAVPLLLLSLAAIAARPAAA